ncbi:MAG TPA: aldehyde dehydrogenase family protein [Sedimentisphaerales bacterium]|nr:aldehyde dehydrogenase family protein [Sedimentisphaerales bacterium]
MVSEAEPRRRTCPPSASPGPPKSKLMAQEIFGPVLTIYVYPENEYDQTLHVCDQTSPYALTGSIFALDRGAIVKAMDVLRHAARKLLRQRQAHRLTSGPPLVVYR